MYGLAAKLSDKRLICQKKKKIGFPLLYPIYFKFVDLKMVSFFFLDVLSFSKVFGIIAFLYVAFSNRYFANTLDERMYYFFLAFLATDFVLL